MEVNNADLTLFDISQSQPKTNHILGPLERRNLFVPKDKVYCLEKLVFRSGVRFLFLLVLTDPISLKLDSQKRTSVLDNPPNGMSIKNAS